jgi:hypothetical protein
VTLLFNLSWAMLVHTCSAVNVVDGLAAGPVKLPATGHDHLRCSFPCWSTSLNAARLATSSGRVVHRADEHRHTGTDLLLNGHSSPDARAFRR